MFESVSISGASSLGAGKPESAALVWRWPAGVGGPQAGRGTHQAGVRVAMVVELFKFIHPHFGGSDAVGQSLVAGVGSLLGENVANVRAGVCFQGPTALPDLCTEQGGGRRVTGGAGCGSTMPVARRPGT